jgi:hypothetical protein
MLLPFRRPRGSGFGGSDELEGNSARASFALGLLNNASPAEAQGVGQLSD